MTGKECYNCHGTGHYNALCRHPRHKKTIMPRPLAGPTTEDPATADIAAIPPAHTGSPTTGAPVTVPPTHTDLLTTQVDTGKAPHQHFTRSVTIHLIHTQVQKEKENYPQFPVKVDPGTDVNNISLNKYRKLFQAHFTKIDNYIQQGTTGQYMMTHHNS